MIITQTPLRISFVGGGTDFFDYYKKHGGAVVSTAIDKYVYVIIKERFDDMIYLNWMKKEIVDNIEGIEHELIREAMRKTGVRKGVEITTLSDIPAEGSGLGSSSSITVGLLQALYLYRGETVGAKQLAEEACDIEIRILKKPIGKQDQYIAGYGGLHLFQFMPDEKVQVFTPKISKNTLQRLDDHLLLFYTGRTRKSSEVLHEQTKNIVDREAILQEMQKQTQKLVTELEKSNVDYMGQALDEGWELKKQLAGGISSPEIDNMYKLAKSAGATGGKIAGAGGGGFLLLYAPAEHHQKIRTALTDFQEMNFHLAQDGTKSIFNIKG